MTAPAQLQPEPVASSRVLHLLRPQRCAVTRWGLACGRPASSALVRDGRLVAHCVRHLAHGGHACE